MMKFQQVTTWASKKHIGNIMRDTPFGQENFSFWAKWSTKYDVGGHHACQEICRTQKDIKNGKGAKQVVEGQLEVLARKVYV